MKILIACEHSGVLRRAFRNQGFDAWSCDLLPPDDYSRHHIQRDVLELLRICDPLDLLIAHPPCTYLARAGAQWWNRLPPHVQMNAVAFAKMLSTHPAAARSAVENPIGKLSTAWRKPDQIIQPWMFGHGETKATCLWLRNLPKLEPTDINPLRFNRVHEKGESKDRWKARSRTYQGIADAMVQQWGSLLQTTL